MTTICITPMNVCICLMRTDDHHAEGGDGEREQQLQAEHAEDSASRRMARQRPGERSRSGPGAGDGRAAEALADDDRAAPDRRDHHLAQKPNSRSTTIEAALNIALNITAMQRTPG